MRRTFQNGYNIIVNTNPSKQRIQAIFLALLVTFIWSSSWVLIKIGLQDIPALTFAGLRYTLAFFCLLPFALRPAYRGDWRNLDRRAWGSLIVLGLLLYSVTQGAQFIGLVYLPAATVSLMLNFTSVLVALMSMMTIREMPTWLQWTGIVINLIGVLIYFVPWYSEPGVSLPPEQFLGLGIVILGVAANAASSVLGRQINRDNIAHPIVITTASMGTGGIVLLISGFASQPAPSLEPVHWGIIVLLAVINTAFAFTVWNYTLRHLSAMESSIINSTMLVQIAVLAWVFLDERLDGREIFGLALAAAGVVIVQLKARSPRTGASSPSSGLEPSSRAIEQHPTGQQTPRQTAEPQSDLGGRSPRRQ